MEQFRLYPKPEEWDPLWEIFGLYTPTNIHNGASIDGDQIKINRSNLIFDILLKNSQKYGEKLSDGRNGSCLVDKRLYWTVYNDIVRVVLCNYGSWLFQEDLEADLPIKKTSNKQHENPKYKIKHC